MIRFLRLYISHIRKPFALFIVFTVCFTVVFWLSHLPLSPILYSALLCLYIGVILLGVDFLKFMKRYKELLHLKNTITVQLEELPLPTNAIESQYHELLQLLNHHKNELIAISDSKQRDASDYFTQWTHQIKTPIAAMRLLLQSHQNELTSELELELLKIEQYVEFVLQFLRLESISNDLVLKQYDLADLIKHALRKNAKLFIRKKISLHYTEVALPVLTDKKWLLFVIEQILSNSLKYTNEGSISIYTQANTLIIQDTGIGIQAEDLPLVFEKGFTGYNGRAYLQSSGIGLYLCKKILTKLSHQITIESQIGVGTKVMIDLETRKIGIE